MRVEDFLMAESSGAISVYDHSSFELKNDHYKAVSPQYQDKKNASDDNPPPPRTRL